ncbi:MAG TPA: ABC transporter ATP-binding protein [Anaerolineae bacterium]|nr:ABC transporter ATP-binding protein [Anaerolineae bacterium]
MAVHGSWARVPRTVDEKPKVTWPLLRRVLAYATPYRWHMVALLALILSATGIQLLTPLVLRDLIDRTIPSGDLRRLALLSGALLALPVLSGLINVAQRRINAYVGEGVIYDLRVGLFDHLQRMSLHFFTNTRLGELMSRVNNDVVGAHTAIASTIVTMITNLVQATALLAVMLSLQWRLTLASLLVMPVFLLAARSLSRRLRDMAYQLMDANAQMNALLNETLSIGGALLVKLFGRTDVELERMRSRAGKVRDVGTSRAVLGTAFFVAMGLVGAAGTALIYGLGGYFVIRGSFSVGTIVAFGSYMGSLYGALQALANAPAEFTTSVVSFERVFEVLDLPLEIDERPDALAIPDVEGELTFENVFFKYETSQRGLLSQVYRAGLMADVTAALSGDTPKPPARGQSNSSPATEAEAAGPALASSRSQAREWALEDVSFTVRPGQLAALVGPSGSGKTTLTYLIPRLYDPTAGRVLLDGHDLRDLRLSSLSAAVGMVTQETYLFHDTIRTNLLYARLDATQADLEFATEAANIRSFIEDLPQGYNTIVGERGYRLSGGEKQRLALARVILKNPRVLLLDEATSSLDSESEALIQEALNRVLSGRTSIVIAHRLSTILAADLILVLDRGAIVERGTHAELLELGGLYAHLYETQFRSSATS